MTKRQRERELSLRDIPYCSRETVQQQCSGATGNAGGGPAGRWKVQQQQA